MLQRVLSNLSPLLIDVSTKNPTVSDYDIKIWTQDFVELASIHNMPRYPNSK